MPAEQNDSGDVVAMGDPAGHRDDLPAGLPGQRVARRSRQHDRADAGTFVADVHTDELIHDQGRPRRTWS